MVTESAQDVVIAHLREQYALGRIQFEEFERRLAVVMLARTSAELAIATSGLAPLPKPVSPAKRRRRDGVKTAVVTTLLATVSVAVLVLIASPFVSWVRPIGFGASLGLIAP